MPSQFIHIEGIGLSASSRHPSWHTVEGVLAEAARAPGAKGHIVKPRPPHLLHGVEPLLVEPKVRAVAAEAVDAKGRRIRRDAVVMYALVASYPVPTKSVSGEALKDYLAWRTATLDWLKAMFGNHLASVVEHLDETHPHLHAVVVPGLDDNGRIDHRLHPGYAAREAARRIGSDHKQAERAYRTGMRGFQDDYATAVSARFGHERVGPRRRRLRRDALLARQGAVMVTTALSALTRGLIAQVPAPDPDTPLRPDVMKLRKLHEACAELSTQLQAGRPPDLNTLMAVIEDIDGRATAGTGASQQESWAADSWEDLNNDVGPNDCETSVDPEDDIDPEADPDWDMDPVEPGEDDPERGFPDEPTPDEDTSW